MIFTTCSIYCSALVGSFSRTFFHFFHHFPRFLDAPGTLVGLPTAELADVSSDDAPVWMFEDDQVSLP